MQQKNGHWETVKLLIEKNTTLVNEKKKYDRTLLMVACMSGCIRSVKILLENHANINDKDVNGDTALIYATPQCWTRYIVFRNRSTIN